jgi:hypothetical protein
MKNKVMLFAVKWMELEVIFLGEINQAQKANFHIFLVMGNLDLT